MDASVKSVVIINSVQSQSSSKNKIFPAVFDSRDRSIFNSDRGEVELVTVPRNEMLLDA